MVAAFRGRVEIIELFFTYIDCAYSYYENDAGNRVTIDDMYLHAVSSVDADEHAAQLPPPAAATRSA